LEWVKNITNKTQKIRVIFMAVFAVIMFTGPIALNSVDDSAFAIHRHHVITAIAVLAIIAVTAALATQVSHATNSANVTQVATSNHQ
jgi:hypothetical protein